MECDGILENSCSLVLISRNPKETFETRSGTFRMLFRKEVYKTAFIFNMTEINFNIRHKWTNIVNNDKTRDFIMDIYKIPVKN